MKARDIMTPHPASVTPTDTIQRVAQLMEEHDCGCLPIVSPQDSHSVLGVVTDRDIALRAVAEGRPADTPVNEVMTAEPSTVRPDAKLEEVEKAMTDRQVRRIVVVDDTGECVGIIAQADLARAARRGRKPTPESFANVVGRISQPVAD